MIRIDPIAPPPRALGDAHRKMAQEPVDDGDDRPHRYGSLEGDAQRAVWEHLYREQHGRCAYCERILPRDSSLTKIEHFHPRRERSVLPWTATCEARTKVSAARWKFIEVSISNLMLCCHGGSKGGLARTCDTTKDDAHICEVFYNLKHITAPAVAQVLSDGRSVVVHAPVPGDPAAQAVVDDTLALNTPSLVRERARLFAAQVRMFKEAGRIDHRPAAVRRREAAARLRHAATTQVFGSTLLGAADYIEHS